MVDAGSELGSPSEAEGVKIKDAPKWLSDFKTSIAQIAQARGDNPQEYSGILPDNGTITTKRTLISLGEHRTIEFVEEKTNIPGVIDGKKTVVTLTETHSEEDPTRRGEPIRVQNTMIWDTTHRGLLRGGDKLIVSGARDRLPASLFYDRGNIFSVKPVNGVTALTQLQADIAKQINLAKQTPKPPAPAKPASAK